MLQTAFTASSGFIIIGPVKHIISILMAGFVVLGMSATAQSATPKPNVLFILCDDLRWDCLGCGPSAPEDAEH